jgi:uncharacterized protein (DUF58 family)
MTKVKEILKRVKKLEIKTDRLVEGLIAGSYHSIFKGRGIEFSEVREYVPGDDIRAIDWNVTARFNSPYIKEFIEERDLNVFIVFDVSASNEFGYEKSKKELGYEIAASIMFAALRNNDNIGLCLFTDHVEKFIRPRKGKKFVLRLLRELIYYESRSRETDLNNSLIYLSKIIRKRSIIFVISDFLSRNFERPLQFLKNKHDVILVKLTDTREEDIPKIGYVFLEDEESREQILVNASDENFRKLYREQIDKRNQELLNKIKKLKVDIVQVKTSESFYIPLRKFFISREKRMVR